MNDVADAAGVTKPVLYQHFDSKRDLYLALLDEVGHRLLTAITKATGRAADGEPDRPRLPAYFRWVAQDHDAFLLLFGAQPAATPEFTQAIRTITDEAAAIAPLIAADIDPEHQRTLAHALVGLAEA